ncbi:response regulator [Parvularcula oceani]|uniref:response regulator n=1 Tax=Parvularcula oceani TaxID=1247963 RepID=UPI00068D667A|nr:response regulator [Parvularcula oceani]
MTAPLILIAEDNALIGMMIQSDLETAGYRVAGPFAQIAPALELAADEAPSLALVDIDLYGGDSGLDLAEALQRMNVPSLFVTGQNREGVANSELALGVLSKPFQSNELLASVEGAICYARTGETPPPNKQVDWF